MNDDDLTRRLRAHSESARTTPGATDRIGEAVAARRRRRHALTTGAAALTVAGVVGVAALAGPGLDSARPTTGGSVTPTTEGSSPTSGSGYTGYTCPRSESVTERVPPPIPDLAEQQAVAAEIEATAWKTMHVKVARPSPLGVVALVERTDMTLEQARSILVNEHGAALVHDWDPGGPEVGLDADNQVTQVLSWEIDEVMPVVRPLRQREGFVNLWVWPDAASIQVFWHGEVPSDVQAMVGDLGNGVRLDPLIPTDWSRSRLASAQGTVTDAVSSGEYVDRWASVGICHDYSGLVAGVPVRSAERRSALSAQLSDLAGLPVMVVDEDPPVDLSGEQ